MINIHLDTTLNLSIGIIMIQNILPSQQCPSPQMLEPCTCDDTEDATIICGGDQPIDLESVFDKLSKLTKKKKYFEELLIRNTAITELKENVIKDVKFEKIFIDRAHSLRRIDPNAFIGSVSNLKDFVIRKCENFDSFDIWTLLNNLENIETINMGDTKITEIPDNAFKGLKKLKSFVIIGESVKRIGVNPFKGLHRIKYIDFINTSISYIPDDAFHFDSSEIRVKIGLFYNKLNGSGFAADAFSHIDRPASVLYMGYIDEENSDRDQVCPSECI